MGDLPVQPVSHTMDFSGLELTYRSPGARLRKRAPAGEAYQWNPDFDRYQEENMDTDLEHMTREELINEVIKLRQAIREHRDSTGHDLCWHHPQLWNQLPEKLSPEIQVPEWSQFMNGCIRYRKSLDEQAPNAPRIDAEFHE